MVAAGVGPVSGQRWHQNCWLPWCMTYIMILPLHMRKLLLTYGSKLLWMKFYGINILSYMNNLSPQPARPYVSHSILLLYLVLHHHNIEDYSIWKGRNCDYLVLNFQAWTVHGINNHLLNTHISKWILFQNSYPNQYWMVCADFLLNVPISVPLKTTYIVPLWLQRAFLKAFVCSSLYLIWEQH